MRKNPCLKSLVIFRVETKKEFQFSFCPSCPSILPEPRGEVQEPKGFGESVPQTRAGSLIPAPS